MKKHYFSVALFFLFISIISQAQPLRKVLLKGSWAPSMPINVLEKADTLVLTPESGMAYGWWKFVKGGEIMISQAQHYCKRMKNGSYSSGTEYRWCVCGHWYTDGDSLEIVSDNILYL